MSSLTFEAAAEQVKHLKTKPSNATLLILYGLYKQATVGDINIPAPWAVQLEAKSKYDAWNAHKGTSLEEAKQKYVAHAQEAIAADK